MPTLGTLRKVDLRQQWPHEAFDFTNWLAQSENLQLLSEEIGASLSLLGTEVFTGRYKVDILAQEEMTGRKVIIENQLEATDHRHLGQIITYAAGLEAEVIVWIVASVNDEHLEAVEWLNRVTNERCNFFLVQMELWQIDNSAYAPRFNVVAKPNEWKKTVGTGGSSSNKQLTDTKLWQLEFWTQLKAYNNSSGSSLKFTRSPLAQHWYTVKAGFSKAEISLNVNSKSGYVSCEFYIHDGKPLFHSLHAQREKIEAAIGETLEWLELPDKTASRVVLRKALDPNDPKNWPACFEWLNRTAEKFSKAFPKPTVLGAGLLSN